MSEDMEIIEHKPQVEIQKRSDSMTMEQIIRQVCFVQEVTKSVMQNGTHYGTIPGCGNKPTLLKPGSEMLNMTFRLAPSYDVENIDMGNGHREYRVTCTLNHINSGAFVGQGVGSCSTMESKYRYRKAEQTCPECGESAIIRGKKEYGGGWLCFAKKGGCGAKFNDGDKAIENQEMGRVEYEDIADYYNTCLKMAKKRAVVDATLTATAASSMFTQDIEDNPGLYGGGSRQQTEDIQRRQSPPSQRKSSPKKSPPVQKVTGGITDGQANAIYAICSKNHDLDKEQVKTLCSEINGIDQISSLRDMDFNQASKCIKAIQDETGDVMAIIAAITRPGTAASTDENEQIDLSFGGAVDIK